MEEAQLTLLTENSYESILRSKFDVYYLPMQEFEA